jgi:hypothetical protein
MAMAEAEWLSMGSPSWLPATVRRAQYLEEQREAREAREAERERAAQLEQRHEQAIASWRSQAEARGEFYSVMEIAQGRVGRTIAEVLDSARASMESEDNWAAARASRQGAEPVHVNFGEPNILMPASPTRRSLLNRSRRWADWRVKQKAADDARRAVEADHDIGLVASQRHASKPDPIADLTVGRRRAKAEPHGDDIRIRGGGPIIGIR